MGWLDDFVKNPVATVSNTVNREVSNFSNSVNSNLADAERGDVGKFISDSAKATGNIAKAPFEVAYYGLRGDTENVSKTIQRAVGSSVNLRGSESGTIFNPMTGGIRLAQSDAGQYVLRNNAVKDATFGLSEDYAGLYRGSRTLQDSAYLSREDQNSIIRLGVKGAVVYGAASVAPKVGAWWDGLSGTQQTIYGSGALGVGDKLSKGDTKGAAKEFAKLTGTPDLSNYIPNPTTDIPSYLPGGSPKSGNPYGSSGTVVKDPWSFSGVSDSGIVNAAQSSILPIALGVGVLAFIYFRGIR